MGKRKSISKSRRKFIKRGLQTLSLAAAHGFVQPRFLFAQTPPGRYKNLVYLFLAGGACPRYLFPYLSGPVDQIIRGKRPNISIPVGDILQLSGMNQGGRQNPIGFHPNWAEFLSMAESTNTSVTMISEYGVTQDVNYSHDIAQKQQLNASSRPPGSVERGLFGRIGDTLSLPSLAVWGVNFGIPNLFNAHDTHPMLVSNISAFNFANRNFGGFNCGALPGQVCGPSGDRYSDSVDDSVFARDIARQISQQTRSDMVLGETITESVSGIFSSVPVAQAINGISMDMSLFRPVGQGYNTEIQNSVADIARSINVLNSSNATIPASLRDSTKLFATLVGGWDMHANINGNYPNNILQLGAALKGLLYYLNLWSQLNSTLIVVVTEFGRTLAQNSGWGVDHGHASYCMLVGGPSIIGRRVVGPDPSVTEADTQNKLTAQLPVTGVMRQVLAEAGISPEQLAQIFPDSMIGENLVPQIFI